MEKTSFCVCEAVQLSKDLSQCNDSCLFELIFSRHIARSFSQIIVLLFCKQTMPSCWKVHPSPRGSQHDSEWWLLLIHGRINLILFLMPRESWELVPPDDHETMKLTWFLMPPESWELVAPDDPPVCVEREDDPKSLPFPPTCDITCSKLDVRPISQSAATRLILTRDVVYDWYYMGVTVGYPVFDIEVHAPTSINDVEPFLNDLFNRIWRFFYKYWSFQGSVVNAGNTTLLLTTCSLSTKTLKLWAQLLWHCS